MEGNVVLTGAAKSADVARHVVVQTDLVVSQKMAQVGCEKFCTRESLVDAALLTVMSLVRTGKHLLGRIPAVLGLLQLFSDFLIFE